jgi:hypothetical protein
MTNKAINQKGIIQFVVLAIIVVAIIAGVWIIREKTNILPKASGLEGQTITSTKDLDAVSSDLDSTNMGQFDSDLNQIGSDSTNF